jgi:two-component system cell cycle response regulator DivK
MGQTRILYVEDNPENRLLVRRALEAEGYRVIEAVDGPSGLRAATESQPDVILLDISLPEIDGYDLARRFADWEHLEGVPVLAVTANVMRGDRERALGAGCDGYIPKPIDIDRLPTQIEDALAQARLRHEGLRPDEEKRTAASYDPEKEPDLPLLDLVQAVSPEADWSELPDADAAELFESLANRRELGITAPGTEDRRLFEARPGGDGGSADRLGERSSKQHAEPRGPVEAIDREDSTVGEVGVADGVETTRREEAVSRDEWFNEQWAEPHGPFEPMHREYAPARVEGAADAVETAGPEEGEGDFVPVEDSEEGVSLAERSDEQSAETRRLLEATWSEVLAMGQGATAGAREAARTRESDVAAEAVDAGTDFSLGGVTRDKLVEEVQRLANELRAEAAVLMRGHRVVAAAGQLGMSRIKQLAAVGQEGFRASNRAALLLGSDQGCLEQITEIGGFHLHALAVDSDLVILTAVRTSVPLGAALLWVKRSAKRMGEWVRQAG